MVRYVTIKKFCEMTGYTEEAVKSKRRDGVWLEGRVWIKAPDGRILIDLEGFERWVESGATWSHSPIGTISGSPTLPRLIPPKGRRHSPEPPKLEGSTPKCQPQPLVPPEEHTRRRSVAK